LSADNFGPDTLWKGFKNQDQVPGCVIIANSDPHLVTIKRAVNKRRTHVEFKENDPIRAPLQYYSLLETAAPPHQAMQGTLAECGDGRPFWQQWQTSGQRQSRVRTSL
jgi:hypothetical protein